jgi:hypothetical protein
MRQGILTSTPAEDHIYIEDMILRAPEHIPTNL